MFISPYSHPFDAPPLDLGALPVASEDVIVDWLASLNHEHDDPAVVALLGMLAAGVGWRQIWFDLLAFESAVWSLRGDVLHLTLRRAFSGSTPAPPASLLNIVWRGLTAGGLLRESDTEYTRIVRVESGSVGEAGFLFWLVKDWRRTLRG